MKNEKREVIYWSCSEDDESLYHKEVVAAVDDFLDTEDTNGMTEVEVFGYAKMVPKIHYDILGELIDYLDSEYGWTDDEPTELTDTMRDAEATFKRNILREYECSACEVVKTVSVDISRMK